MDFNYIRTLANALGSDVFVKYTLGVYWVGCVLKRGRGEGGDMKNIQGIPFYTKNELHLETQKKFGR